MTRLTLKAAQQLVAQHSVRITSKDGEYRVADMFAPMADIFPDESRAQILARIELRAYYTNDLEDAVNTARFFRPALAA